LLIHEELYSPIVVEQRSIERRSTFGSLQLVDAVGDAAVKVITVDEGEGGSGVLHCRHGLSVEHE
jgi:hypothetical protein